MPTISQLVRLNSLLNTAFFFIIFVFNSYITLKLAFLFQKLLLLLGSLPKKS